MQIFRIVLFTAGLIMAISGLGLAQNKAAAAKKANAEKADEQARAYFKVSAFESAAKEFARAYQLEQKATRLYNAGLAYEKAGMPREASEFYGRFLEEESEGSKAVETRARKLAIDKKLAEEERLASEASAKSARAAQLQSHTSAAQEQLAAGSYAAAAESFEQAYQLSQDVEYLFDKAEAQRAGHLNSAALASYRQYRRMAPSGINVNSARLHQEELESGPPARSSQRKTWALGLGAVGLLGLSAGAYFSFDTISKRDDALDPDIGGCDSDFKVCNPTGIQLFADAKDSATLTGISVGVGAAACLAGIVMWVTAKDTGSPNEARVQVLPSLGDDALGLVLVGGY